MSLRDAVFPQSPIKSVGDTFIFRRNISQCEALYRIYISHTKCISRAAGTTKNPTSIRSDNKYANLNF